jgi:hypothetical protein
MKIKIFSLILMVVINSSILTGQESIVTAGNSTTGTGGSVSYSAGQVAFGVFTGTNGSIVQGVQQPYEISVLTAIENTTGITLECSVYPNPTTGPVKLKVESPDPENLRVRLFDFNGVILLDKKIDSGETEISLESYKSSVYFLKVIKKNKEVKVFRIVKR